MSYNSYERDPEAIKIHIKLRILVLTSSYIKQLKANLFITRGINIQLIYMIMKKNHSSFSKKQK